MLIRRVRLLNFRQHADTVLELDEGLTGIVGPNGAGKTTLLEAIAWAMYGNPAARGTRDTIRRRSAPPRSRVEVELDFELGPHRYRVVRSLQSAALYQDDEPAAIANSPASVTDKVTRILRMTREEFFNTYFTGQKELAIMASMSAPDRARFLSRVLGYDRLAAAQVRLKEARSALRASLQTAETGLIDAASLATEEHEADARLTTAGTALAQSRAHATAAAEAFRTLVPVWESLQRRREEVLSVETDLKVAAHQADEARRTFEGLDRELAESLGAKTKRDELLPALADWEPLVKERDALDADAQAFSGRRALEARVGEVTTALAAAAARLERLLPADLVAITRDELAKAREEAAQAVLAVEERHTVWVRDKQDAETQRKNLLQQHEDVAKQLERLRATGPTVVCPTCGKPLGKEYEAVLDDLQTRHDDILFQGKFYRQRIDQLTPEPPDLKQVRAAAEQDEKRVAELTRALAQVEAAVAERAGVERERAQLAERLAVLERELAAVPGRYDEERHRQVRARLAQLEPLREQVTRLTVAADRGAQLVPRAAEAEQVLSKAEARVIELRHRLQEFGWSSETFEQTRTAYQRADQERQVAEVRRVRAESELAAANEHRAAVARRRAERQIRLEEVERLGSELTLNQELDRGFTDLREELNATIRPDLSDSASALLRDLSGGRYADLELDEDYMPTIVDDGEPKTVISGGEEDVANLALRLAISQMIADRAGQPFSLLVLDEIFGSLDEERRMAVLDLLRSLADRFPQVILITHIESVRDGFDRVIRIAYDVEQGLATAREERLGEVPHVAA
jgi:DNA repair protein SbcC/Rad50